MPRNAFFLRTRDLLVSQKTTQRHFFPTLHPLTTVSFATATGLAFVLLRNSRFNFHCYTQREAAPTQKSARKCAATSRDFLRKRLQSAFTLANQLRWIAQYSSCICWKPKWLSQGSKRQGHAASMLKFYALKVRYDRHWEEGKNCSSRAWKT